MAIADETSRADTVIYDIWAGERVQHFPLTTFKDGLANMRWFDLAAELSELIAAPAWQSGLDIEVLQRHLYAQLDMTEVAPPDPPPDPLSGVVENTASDKPGTQQR